MGQSDDTRLAEVEDDHKPVAGWKFRTVSLQFAVKSNSDGNALDIGHCLLQILKDEQMIGPTDGNVVLGP